VKERPDSESDDSLDTCDDGFDSYDSMMK